MYLILRPRIREDLLEISKYANLFAYTAALYDYGAEIIKILDIPGFTVDKMFATNRKPIKNINTLIPDLTEQNRMLIIDDTVFVWKNGYKSLIQSKKFYLSREYNEVNVNSFKTEKERKSAQIQIKSVRLTNKGHVYSDDTEPFNVSISILTSSGILLRNSRSGDPVLMHHEILD